MWIFFDDHDEERGSNTSPCDVSQVLQSFREIWGFESPFELFMFSCLEFTSLHLVAHDFADSKGIEFGITEATGIDSMALDFRG